MEKITKSKTGLYKIVKYCRICRTRFIILKGDSKKNYCEKCELKITK